MRNIFKDLRGVLIMIAGLLGTKDIGALMEAAGGV